eukprot:870380-Rhodomonas_salina.1
MLAFQAGQNPSAKHRLLCRQETTAGRHACQCSLASVLVCTMCTTKFYQQQKLSKQAGRNGKSKIQASNTIQLLQPADQLPVISSLQSNDSQHQNSPSTSAGTSYP